MKQQFTIIFFCLFSLSVFAQTAAPAFRVVPLGVKGGIDETNLSAYMVAPSGTNEYVCLDAGTIHAGIEKAVANKTFSVSSSEVLKKYIKGYFISHAHLDHVSGLIINSPDDTAKTIYALPECITMLENYYFNGEAWANFGDEGKGVLLKRYHYEKLGVGEQTPVTNTRMTVKAFPLSHVNPYKSTAFLLNNAGDYVLYLGDTGPDELEKSDKLQLLWQEVAPLIKAKKLRAIFIEVSFPDEQPDNRLFGHLTPKWLMKEMTVLSSMTGVEALKNFKLVITHIKPPAENEKKIKQELKEQNKFDMQFIYPVQGKAFKL